MLLFLKGKSLPEYPQVWGQPALGPSVRRPVHGPRSVSEENPVCISGLKRGPKPPYLLCPVNLQPVPATGFCPALKWSFSTLSFVLPIRVPCYLTSSLLQKHQFSAQLTAHSWLHAVLLIFIFFFLMDSQHEMNLGKSVKKASGVLDLSLFFSPPFFFCKTCY